MAPVPYELAGNRLVACVVAAGPVKGVALSRACRERLPPYMVPDRFEFVGALPRTSTDKTDRRALSERFGHRER